MLNGGGQPEAEQWLIMCCSAWEASVGPPNDCLDLTDLTMKEVSALTHVAITLAGQHTVPLLAVFWQSVGISPAPVLAPSEASAALPAPDGSSLYKYQSAPAAPEWTTGTHPRYHSSAATVRCGISQIQKKM